MTREGKEAKWIQYSIVCDYVANLFTIDPSGTMDYVWEFCWHQLLFKHIFDITDK